MELAEKVAHCQLRIDSCVHLMVTSFIILKSFNFKKEQYKLYLDFESSQLLEDLTHEVCLYVTILKEFIWKVVNEYSTIILILTQGKAGLMFAFSFVP